MCNNFQLKRTTLTFLAQIFPKRKLGFEIQKTNVGIRISMLEIPCVPILKENGHLWLFGSKFAQEWILGSKFQKSKSRFGMSSLEILCIPIFKENGQLWIFGPKFAQKWILGLEFQKSKSGLGINTSNVPYVPIFSQNGQLLIFRPKFRGNCPITCKFWFKYCWGCCRELGWGGWSWVEVKMSWVEVDGTGWRWVHGLVISFSLPFNA